MPMEENKAEWRERDHAPARTVGVGSRIVRTCQTVWAPLDDRLALLDVATGRMYDVDRMTVRIWHALADGPTFAEVVMLVGDGCGLTSRQLARDVAVRLERLLEDGLITWR